jgi:hypothetical protein
MTVNRILWVILFILGLANLLLFVSDGETHNFVAACFVALIAGFTYNKLWRKE